MALKNIARFKKNLLNIDKALNESALFVLSDVLKKWDQAKGADGRKMKPLSSSYKKKKEKIGGVGIPNMLLTGKMRSKFGVIPITKTSYKIGWTDGKMRERAEYNEKRRNNLLKVTKKLRLEATEVFKKSLGIK